MKDSNSGNWHLKDKTKSNLSLMDEDVYSRSIHLMEDLRSKNSIGKVESTWQRVSGGGKLEMDWKRAEPFKVSPPPLPLPPIIDSIDKAIASSVFKSSDRTSSRKNTMRSGRENIKSPVSQLPNSGLFGSKSNKNKNDIDYNRSNTIFQLTTEKHDELDLADEDLDQLIANFNF
jgi:hypothetical protein